MSRCAVENSGGVEARAVRDAIDRAVHEAVRGHTGGDGAFRCLFYAVAGAYACERVLGGRYLPQVGSMDLRFARDPDRWLPIDASGGGLCRGEYHAWVVRVPGPPADGLVRTTDRVEWIDFSARHYPRLVSDLFKVTKVLDLPRGVTGLALAAPTGDTWQGTPPPEYVWPLEPAPALPPAPPSENILDPPAPPPPH